MTLHDATHQTARRASLVRLPHCPLCGETLLAPMLAQHVSERLVENHWACEACGYTFRKSFDFQRGRRQEAELCA